MKFFPRLIARVSARRERAASSKKLKRDLAELEREPVHPPADAALRHAIDEASKPIFERTNGKQTQALRKLVDFHHPYALPAMEFALNSHDFSVIDGATNALAMQGDPRAIPILARYVNRIKDEDVQNLGGFERESTGNAVKAIGTFEHPTAIAYLRSLLGNERYEWHQWVAAALLHNEHLDAMDARRQVLERENQDATAQTVGQLFKRANDSTHPLAQKAGDVLADAALRAPNFNVRLFCMRALKDIKRPDHFGVFTQGLTDSHAQVRPFAALGLYGLWRAAKQANQTTPPQLRGLDVVAPYFREGAPYSEPTIHPQALVSAVRAALHPNIRKRPKLGNGKLFVNQLENAANRGNTK